MAFKMNSSGNSGKCNALGAKRLNEKFQVLYADMKREARKKIKKEQSMKLCQLHCAVESGELSFSMGLKSLPKGIRPNKEMTVSYEAFLRGLYKKAVSLDENEAKRYFHLSGVQQDLYQADLESKNGHVWVSWDTLLEGSPELSEQNLRYILNSPSGKKYIHTYGRMCSSRIWPHGSGDVVFQPPKASAVFKGWNNVL